VAERVDLFDDLMGSHTYEGEYLQSNTIWVGDNSINATGYFS
jgi:hypothetical protein